MKSSGNTRAPHLPADPPLRELFTAIADDFGMLARLHDTEPDAALLETLRDQGFPDGLGLKMHGDGADQAVEFLRLTVSSLPESMDADTLDALAADYASIYLNYGIQASPEESVWIDEENLAYQRSMFLVRKWYSRYGLKAPDWRRRPDDHLVFELQFLEYLFRNASSRDELNAAARFMDEHLLRWVTRFSERVGNRCGTPYFAGVAMLTGAYCREVRDLLAEITGEPVPDEEEIEQRMKPDSVSHEVPLQYMPGIGPAV